VSGESPRKGMVEADPRAGAWAREGLSTSCWLVDASRAKTPSNRVHPFDRGFRRIVAKCE
jgi:hypothetical protein